MSIILLNLSAGLYTANDCVSVTNNYGLIAMGHIKSIRHTCEIII